MSLAKHRPAPSAAPAPSVRNRYTRLFFQRLSASRRRQRASRLSLYVAFSPLLGLLLASPALAASAPVAWVTNYHAGSVVPIAIPEANNFVVDNPIYFGEETEYRYPVGIAADPSGEGIFVGLQGYGIFGIPPALALIDSGGDVIGSLKTGAQPVGVAVSPNRKYVVAANANENSVTEYIDEGGSVSEREISLSSAESTGKPQFIAVSADSTTAYVSVEVNQSAVASEGVLIPIDLSTGTPGTPISLQPADAGSACGAAGVAVVPNSPVVLVACAFGDGVNAVDTSTKTSKAVYLSALGDNLGDGKMAQVAVTPDAKMAVVTWVNLDGGALSFLNLANPTSPVDESSEALAVPDENPQGIAITPDGSAALVAGYESGRIYVAHLDTAHPELDKESIPDPDGANSGPDMIAMSEVPLPAVESGSAPTIGGTLIQGQVLSERHASWSGTPASFSYQWLDCDSAGNNCQGIAGATGQGYTLTAADVGHTLRVQEIAYNAAGSGGPVTSVQTGLVQAPAQQPPAKTTTAVSAPPPPSSSVATNTAPAGVSKIEGKGNAVELSIACSGAVGSCLDELQLIAYVYEVKWVVRKHHRVRHKATRKVVLGSLRVSLAAGKSASVQIKLNHKAAALLRKRHVVQAHLTVTPVGGGATTTAASITLKAPSGKRQKKHK